MTWSERLNAALDSVEADLPGEVDAARAARLAGLPQSAFLRTFAIVTGFPLGEYVRRRRLTLAGLELQSAPVKVVDVAVKYGYESPEAFSRAFRAVHGISPSAARREGASLKAFPRLSFLLTIKGECPMDYRIETKEPFLLFGIEESFTMENESNLREIPLFWQRIWEDGRGQALIEAADVPDEGMPLLSVCGYEELPEGRFPYMICALAGPESRPEGYRTVQVPGATWAIFRTGHHTQEAVAAETQAVIRRVYTDWLPTAPFELVPGYDLEVYCCDDRGCYTEAWFRVRPK